MAHSYSVTVVSIFSEEINIFSGQFHRIEMF